MTPEQIRIVETTVASVGLDDLTADFYRRVFEQHPELTAMFTTDPAVQRERFAVELATIVGSIRGYDDFMATTRALGRRHQGYGVRAGHFRLMREALLDALAHALADQWTDEVEEAWRLAYNLTAEAMMTAMADRRD